MGYASPASIWPSGRGGNGYVVLALLLILASYCFVYVQFELLSLSAETVTTERVLDSLTSGCPGPEPGADATVPGPDVVVDATAPELGADATGLRGSIKNDPYGWPGVPVEELGNKLVQKGTNFVANSRALLMEHLDEFLQVYADRPDKVNLCGIRINHAYALYIGIKALNPTALIESGVNAGQSTYFMRAAAPNAKIYPIDPLAEPICGQEKRWIDTVNAEYYTGDDFKDFGQIDWAGKIASGEVDPSRTLVFLDDHLRVFDRFSDLMKFGFRHILLEDNYKVWEGATPADKAGWTPKQMLVRVDPDSEFLFHQLVSYAEFPPLVPPIMAKALAGEPRKKAGGFLHANDENIDIVAPILRPDLSAEDKDIYERICAKLGLDPEIKDGNTYMQLMNYNQFTYFELRPMAPRLLEAA